MSFQTQKQGFTGVKNRLCQTNMNRKVTFVENIILYAKHLSLFTTYTFVTSALKRMLSGKIICYVAFMSLQPPHGHPCDIVVEYARGNKMAFDSVGMGSKRDVSHILASVIRMLVND